MDKCSKGMSWLGRMYCKFEDTVESMCSGVEDILQQQQEGLEYVENKLQTARANVKQICSEIVQEILPISENSVETEYSLAQESDDSNVLSVEENEKKRFQLLKFDSVAVTSDKKIRILPALSAISEDILKNSFYNEKQPKLERSISNTSNNEYPSSSISSTTSEDIHDSSFYKDEQVQLETFHYITSDDENLSSSVSSLPPYNGLELSSLHPDDLLKYFRKKFPLGYQSSDSVSSLKSSDSVSSLQSSDSVSSLQSSDSVSSLQSSDTVSSHQSSDSVSLLQSSDSVSSLQSFQSALWGSEDGHSDVSDELVEKSGKSIDETKLEESCMVGDSSELLYEEEKLAALTAKEAYGNEHAAACWEFKSSENEGEGQDECEFAEGHDECESGEGHDECKSVEGHDECKSGEGNDECEPEEGHDESREGHDECESDEGHDESESDKGLDECESDEGHDESEFDWVIV